MAPGDWAQYARALRVQRKFMEQKVNEAPSDNTLTATSAAALVLLALECAAEQMAGGPVYD